jgi:hypothetical protein
VALEKRSLESRAMHRFFTHNLENLIQEDMTDTPSGRAGRQLLRIAEPETLRVMVQILGTLSIMLMAIPAVAATDGLVGSISSGNIGIFIRKTNVVAVSGLADIVLPAWNLASPAPSGSTDICVFSSLGGFEITASSAHSQGSDFRLSNGNDSIAYRVRWRDEDGESLLSNGTPLSNRRGDSISRNCRDRLPAQLAIHVPLQEMRTAREGGYVDTLTIVVAPE